MECNRESGLLLQGCTAVDETQSSSSLPEITSRGLCEHEANMESSLGGDCLRDREKETDRDRD